MLTSSLGGSGSVGLDALCQLLLGVAELGLQPLDQLGLADLGEGL